MAKKKAVSRKNTRASAIPSPNGRAARDPVTKDRPAKNAAATRRPTKKKNDKRQDQTHLRWTFLTNHAHVLAVLHNDPQCVIREVAAQVGITERAVQRIIQELEEGGFIVRKKIGRRNHYRVAIQKSLRHSLEAHKKIGDLLAMISK